MFIFIGAVGRGFAVTAQLVKITVGLLCFSSWEIEQSNKGKKEDELEGIRMHDFFNVSQHHDIMVEDRWIFAVHSLSRFP